MLFTMYEPVKEGYRIAQGEGYVSINAGDSSITLHREQFDALFFAMEAFYADEEALKQLEESNANSEERD